MARDLELDQWRTAWRAASDVSINLGARVERETRRMRYFLAAEILITAIFGGGSLAAAVTSGREDLLLLAGGVWSFIAIAWVMAWVLRRGAWSAIAATTAAFLELSILRCRRQREAAIAQAVLYVMILTFDLWFIRTHGPPHSAGTLAAFLTSPTLLIVWVITGALATLGVGRYRRLGRELEALLALQRNQTFNA